MINEALEAKPEDMTITMHICRGNFRSTWFSSGGYEPVAETLFGGLLARRDKPEHMDTLKKLKITPIDLV